MPETVSEKTLKNTVRRTLPFLRAITTRAAIRDAMAAVGYDAAEQRHGWELVTLICGARPPKLADGHDEQARSALAEIDATDEPLFRRGHAALAHLHPDQDAFVFDGLSPGRGAQSVVSIATFLDRLDALENSPERAATRAEDHAALATLAKRGIGPDTRQHLRALLAIAQSAEFPVEVEPEGAVEGDREEALLELRAWYKDWAETARAVISRRDYLILMGLAHRKHSVREPSLEETEEDEVEIDEAEVGDETAPDAFAPPATV